MLNSSIIGIAVVFLFLLLFYEKRRNTTGIFLTKPSLSVLFVVAAWLQSGSDDAYARWILIGLLLSLVGDVCLIFSSRRMFLSGLFAFLTGHVFYAIAFFTRATPGAWTFVGLVVVSLAGTWIFRWLRPFLGKMMGPAIAYIVVISLMVAAATSALGDAAGAGAGRWLVFGGAVSFYVSDICVARQRFVRSEFLNRAIGLPLYYLGQFMLAFSIGRM